MSDPSSSNTDTDPDLRDVFALLYADDDWTFNASDSEDEDSGAVRASRSQSGKGTEQAEADEVHPPLNSFIPEADLERIERVIDVNDNVRGSEQVGKGGNGDEGEGSLIDTKKYSRKRFLDAIDSLFLTATASVGDDPSSIEGLAPKRRRRRIYAIPKGDVCSQSTIITSTQPIPVLPSPTTYAPFSPLALLSRLRTYRIHSYPYPSLYPEYLSPITAAFHGWINDNNGRDGTSEGGLSCGYCGARWSLAGLADIQDERVRNEVARRLGEEFKGRHKDGCAWRVRSSPDELYTQLRNLLHPPISSHLAPLAERLSTSTATPTSSSSSISYKTPLSPSQRSALLASLKQHIVASSSSSITTATPTSTSTSSIGITDLGANLALFGWYPYYPNAPSLTHITVSNTSTTAAAGGVGAGGKTEIVSCRFCQRRVGLWSFSSSSANDGTSTGLITAPTTPKEKEIEMERSFDLVNEHVGWCPIRPRPGLQPRLRRQSRSLLESPGQSPEKPWWADCALLSQRDNSAASTSTAEVSTSASAPTSMLTSASVNVQSGPNKGWVVVSDKLEKRPWRRYL
ncbi:hypothetical protein I317_03134 [Kwoniella heveanensis CBS 569]|nr:hypothetical protein I317_03134 [Kwoniella heveanensis CBS 569]